MKKTELEKLRIENKALVKLNGILFNENASLKKKQNHNVEILVQLFEAIQVYEVDIVKVARVKKIDLTEAVEEDPLTLH